MAVRLPSLENGLYSLYTGCSSSLGKKLEVHRSILQLTNCRRCLDAYFTLVMCVAIE